MRALRLARIAAEAEALRLRRQAQRNVVRAVMAVIALAFLAIALAFGHAAGWFALRVGANMASWATALVLGGIDLAIALVFMVIALMSGPGRVETEAYYVRQRALENATSGLAVSSLVIPALRVGMGMLRK